MSEESLEDLVRRLRADDKADNQPSFEDRSVSEGANFRSEYIEKGNGRFRSDLLLHQLTKKEADKILKKKR